jgi:hypothetical protein
VFASNRAEELADDIKANGLIHPIVLDAEGTLIDGRNRLRACELAGVAPAFTALGDHDPVAYILSPNVNRRHLTAGQRAMAAARARRSETGQSQRVGAGCLVNDAGAVSGGRRAERSGRRIPPQRRMRRRVGRG